MKHLQLGSAWVTGASHRQLDINNQDALATFVSPELIVGVVADGCGAGMHSEVGAQLGARFVLDFCIRNCKQGPFDAAVLLQSLIEYLHQLCDLQQPRDRAEFIEQHLLFTLLGFIVRPNQTDIFYAGDGFVLLNDKLMQLDHGNRPPYIGRHLLGQKATLLTDKVATASLDRLLISTDGLRDLPTPIPTLFDDPDHLRDPVALPRHLTSLAHAGALKDDVAVVMLGA